MHLMRLAADTHDTSYRWEFGIVQRRDGYTQVHLHYHDILWVWNWRYNTALKGGLLKNILKTPDIKTELKHESHWSAEI